MRELNQSEVFVVNGASIKPSHWMFSSAYGTMFGAACWVVAAFSFHPVDLFSALVVGGGLGLGFHAAYDILHENGL